MDLRDWVPIALTTQVLGLFAGAPRSSFDAGTAALRLGEHEPAVRRVVTWLASEGWLVRTASTGAHGLAPGREEAARHVLAHTESHRADARRSAQFQRAGRHARHSIAVTADRTSELAGMADALERVLSSDPGPGTEPAVRALVARVRRGGAAGDGEPPFLADQVYMCSIRSMTHEPAPPLTIPDPPGRASRRGT